MAVGGQGTATRTWIGLQVLLLLLLAAAGAALSIHLSQRRALRFRTDLTLDARNTLAPETEALLAALPEEARIDVFLRPEAQPLSEASLEAIGLMRELLTLAESAAPERIALEFWDVRGDFENAQARLGELALREDQVVVISIGERRAVLRLWSDIAEIDPGSRDPRQPAPPTLHAFRGQEALCSGLAQVARTDRPVACFSTGRAESAIEGAEPGDASLLARELEAQGFETRTWDPARDGALSDECDLLVVLSPDQPFRAEDVDAIDRWVSAGGRLLCTASPSLVDEDGSTGELLARFGIRTARGIVGVPYLDPFTGRPGVGSTRCAEVEVPGEDMSAHEITTPLVESGHRFAVWMSRSFELQGSGARRVLPLLHSPTWSWRDLPSAEDGRPDFVPDPEREESGRFVLAASSQITPISGPRVDSRTGATLEGRVVAVASSSAALNHFWIRNRAFLVNAANWLVERDLSVHLTPPAREREDPRLDVVRGRELPILVGSMLWGLPGLCAFLGVLVYLLRRRG